MLQIVSIENRIRPPWIVAHDPKASRGGKLANSVSVLPIAPWAERAANSAIFLCSGLGIGAWAASIALLQARLNESQDHSTEMFSLFAMPV